ncbi:hypothetical protein EDC65_4596 [Stella humosa]|uniref:Uncharacterized protein n=1 Tax=Stella humosa TaxID=94 RepID=A0A3N1KXP5_9PROT|nr:hypothetical protein EDC65_4596 [Stella humosa]BBK30158.1 hypothetical protein STHU_07920 [Stella humosa]
MKAVFCPPNRSEGAVTRFLFLLIALGSSMMLLAGAALPLADGDEPPIGFDLLVASLERVREFLGG